MSSLASLEIAIPNNWIPRDDQMAAWEYLEDGGLRAVEVAHRRWGKDDIALHMTATKAHERIGNYWHMLPKYAQARKAIWDAVNPRTGKKRIDEAFPPEIRRKTRSHEMLIELKCGSIWQLVGSDNYDTLVGSPPVGIVFSEYALADPMAWAYLVPILEENKGWALFISTSRGNNHLKQLFDYAKVTPGWFAQKLTADDSPVFTADQLKRIKQDYIAQYGEEMGAALFEQEYYCSFEGAMLGSYYGKQISQARRENRITVVPYQPGVEVDTFWDLGVDDSMSIWFMQPAGKAYHFIDYYESSGYGLEHYAKVLKGKDYVYGNHYMPHDAEVREMTNSEVALTRKEVAENLGIRPVEVVSRVRSMDIVIQVHVPAVRNILASCWFDEKKCQRGISALEGYRSEYDEEKRILSNRPFRDWTTHGADAFRTFAVGYSLTEKHKTKTEEYFPHDQGWMR